MKLHNKTKTINKTCVLVNVLFGNFFDCLHSLSVNNVLRVGKGAFLVGRAQTDPERVKS